MHKYKTLDGKPLEAESLQGLAEVLWQMGFNPEVTLEEWMLGSAKRAKMWDGSVIRTSSPEEHMQDLIDTGFLTLDA